MTLMLPEVPELRPNSQAMPLVKKLIQNQEQLKVRAFEHNGVHIIDCGSYSNSYGVGNLPTSSSSF